MKVVLGLLGVMVNVTCQIDTPGKRKAPLRNCFSEPILWAWTVLKRRLSKQNSIMISASVPASGYLPLLDDQLTKLLLVSSLSQQKESKLGQLSGRGERARGLNMTKIQRLHEEPDIIHN